MTQNVLHNYLKEKPLPREYNDDASIVDQLSTTDLLVFLLDCTTGIKRINYKIRRRQEPFQSITPVVTLYSNASNLNFCCIPVPRKKKAFKI